jgi:predicted dithiol-disulfide oxidoreductase (DUF899 family)
MSKHRTGTRDKWRPARVEPLKPEKEHSRRSDELARMRRDLPWIRIDKPYAFGTDEGTKTLAKLFGGRSSWCFDWVSSSSRLQRRLRGLPPPGQQNNGAEYNCRLKDDPGDGHGLSSFALEDGVVYHVSSTYGRGTDFFNTFYQLLDRAPKGRDVNTIPAGQWWWRRHDEYDNNEERP